MAPLKFIVFFVLLSIVINTHAKEGKKFISLEAGRSELDLKREFSIVGRSDSLRNTILGVSLGYQFLSNVIVEGNFSAAANDNLFSSHDDYKLYEVQALLGYSFKVADWLRIVPKIGLSRWELDTKEGKFLNPGPEAEDEFTGDDRLFQLHVEFPINDLVQLYLSHTREDYEFGEIKSLKFGVKFDF